MGGPIGDARAGRGVTGEHRMRPWGERGALGGDARWRAIAALLLVTGAAALIVADAETIVLAITGWNVALTSDFALDLAFRTLLPLMIIVLALIAAALFGHRLRLGSERPVWTATALPAGFGAITLTLMPVALADAIGDGGQAGTSAGLLLAGTLVVLIGVLAEEVLLRGVLQPVLERAFGLWPALLLSAFAFALIHVAGGWTDAVTFLNVVLASLWFGLLADRTGGLAAPVLAHFGYNWSEELLFGASPNPGVGSFGALFDLDLVGSTRLGGSIEGMNASPIVSLVLALLIVILAADVPRRAPDRERKAGRA